MLSSYRILSSRYLAKSRCALGLLTLCIGRSSLEASNPATTIGAVFQFFTGMYFQWNFFQSYINKQIGRTTPMTYTVQTSIKMTKSQH